MIITTLVICAVNARLKGIESTRETALANSICRGLDRTGAMGAWHPQNFEVQYIGNRKILRFYVIKPTKTNKTWPKIDRILCNGTCGLEFLTRPLT